MYVFTFLDNSSISIITTSTIATSLFLFFTPPLLLLSLFPLLDSLSLQLLLSPFLALFNILCRSPTHTYTHSHSLTLTHTHLHSHTLTHTLTLTLTRSFSFEYLGIYGLRTSSRCFILQPVYRLTLLDFDHIVHRGVRGYRPFQQSGKTYFVMPSSRQYVGCDLNILGEEEREKEKEERRNKEKEKKERRDKEKTKEERRDKERRRRKYVE